MYIYLDREEAKKGFALVLGASETKIEDYKNHYEGRAIEYVGDDIPHYITFDETTDTIREATETEKLERNQITLEDNQVIIDNQIYTYDKKYQKVVDNKIIDKTLKELLEENIMTLEEAKHQKRRVFRQVLLDKLYADFEYQGKVFQMGEADELNFLRVKSALDIVTNSNDTNTIINAIKLLKVEIPVGIEDKLKNKIELIQGLKINWRMKDNSVCQFTFADINKVYLLWILRGTTAQEEYTEIAGKVMSCKNLDELEAIKWV